MVSSQLTFSQAPPLTLENLLTTALLFSSLAQRQMSLKMQLTQNICVLDSVPTVCFPVLLPPAFWSFLKIENTIQQHHGKEICKKEKNTHSATFLTNIAISTPTILLLILHLAFCLFILFFLSRSSDILSSSHFPVFFLILAPSFGFWSWVTERALQLISILSLSPDFIFLF